MTGGVKSGKAQNERMFFQFGPESEIVATSVGLSKLPGVGPTRKLNGSVLMSYHRSSMSSE